MNGELVSIVVPVYNVVPYLDQCIASIVNQTYQNIEVILVDDGSTDGSGELCKKYSRKDKRIKLISQTNHGVVSARKNGSAQATGEYIGFVDADDYIDADLYERLMACRDGFDLVISQWYREENGNTRRAFDKIALGAYETEADIDFLLDHMINVSVPGGSATIKSGLAPFMYTKLYKTALVRDVFQEVNEDISVWEDCEFCYRYLLKSRKVLLTDICGYHYRIHAASAVHSADSGCRYLKNVCRLYEALHPVFQSHPKHDSLVFQLQFKISSLLARVPKKMGFPAEAQNRAVVFPFLNLLDNKRIVLYGAGEIGIAYWQQIQKFSSCEIILWVDKRWQDLQRAGWDVSRAEDLSSMLYDNIVLAIETEDEAEEVKKQLALMGVAVENILWRAPLFL